MNQKGTTENRLKTLRNKMADERIDCFLVSGRENCYYLSGFTGDYGFLVITDSRQIVFVDSRFVEQAKIETPDWEVRQFLRFHQDLSSLLTELKAKYVGFESNRVSYEDFKELERNSPSIVFVPFRYFIERIRAIKDEDELKKIKDAVTIAEMALSGILGDELEGKSEEAVALDLEWKMRLNGAQKVGFDLIIASGYRSALPHGVASQKTINGGEALLFDWGAFKDFYCSDITRTFFTGSPTIKQRDVYLTVKEALEEAIAYITAGKSCFDVHKFALSRIQDSPFKDFAFGHGLGHGVGLEVHELPFLNARSEDLLEPGMVLTVEPGIYIPGWGGVRLEDMVLITEKGVEVLTSFPKEISVI